MEAKQVKPSFTNYQPQGHQFYKLTNKKIGIKKLKKSFENVKNWIHFEGVNFKRLKIDFTMVEQIKNIKNQRKKNV